MGERACVRLSAGDQTVLLDLTRPLVDDASQVVELLLHSQPPPSVDEWGDVAWTYMRHAQYRQGIEVVSAGLQNPDSISEQKGVSRDESLDWLRLACAAFYMRIGAEAEDAEAAQTSFQQAEEVLRGCARQRTTHHCCAWGYLELSKAMRFNQSSSSSLAEARKKFTESLSLDVLNPMALLGRAEACQFVADFKGALGSYSKVLKNVHKGHSAFHRAKLGLASCLSALNRKEEAVKAVAELREQHPADVDVVLLHGILQGAEECTAAMDLYPDHPVSQCQEYDVSAVRAFELSGAEKQEELAQCRDDLAGFLTSVCGRKARAEAHFQLGRLFHESGESPKAQKLYAQCLEAFPKHYACLYHAAQLAVELRDLATAKKHLDVVLEANSEDVAALRLSIFVCHASPDDRSDLALSMLDRVIKVDESEHKLDVKGLESLLAALGGRLDGPARFSDWGDQILVTEPVAISPTAEVPSGSVVAKIGAGKLCGKRRPEVLRPLAADIRALLRDLRVQEAMAKDRPNDKELQPLMPAVHFRRDETRDAQLWLIKASLHEGRKNGGEAESALACYEHCRRIRVSDCDTPSEVEAALSGYIWNNIGTLRLMTGHPDGARAAYLVAKRRLQTTLRGGDSEAVQDAQSALVTLSYNLARLEEMSDVPDYKAAKSTYQHILDKSPQYIDAKLCLGMQCCSNGAFQEAVELFKAAGELDPAAIDPVVLQAQALQSSGDLQGAIGVLEDLSARLRPRVDAYTCVLLGNMYLDRAASLGQRISSEKQEKVGPIKEKRQHELSKALTKYIEVMESQEEGAVSYYAAQGVGIVLALRNKVQEAKFIFQKLPETHDKINVNVNLGHLYFDSANREPATAGNKTTASANVLRAIRHYHLALEAKPAELEIRLCLAGAYRAAGMLKECIGVLEAGLLWDSSCLRLKWNLAFTLQKFAHNQLEDAAEHGIGQSTVWCLKSAARIFRAFHKIMVACEHKTTDRDKSRLKQLPSAVRSERADGVKTYLDKAEHLIGIAEKYLHDVNDETRTVEDKVRTDAAERDRKRQSEKQRIERDRAEREAAAIAQEKHAEQLMAQARAFNTQRAAEPPNKKAKKGGEKKPDAPEMEFGEASDEEALELGEDDALPLPILTVPKKQPPEDGEEQGVPMETQPSATAAEDLTGGEVEDLFGDFDDGGNAQETLPETLQEPVPETLEETLQDPAQKTVQKIQLDELDADSLAPADSFAEEAPESQGQQAPQQVRVKTQDAVVQDISAEEDVTSTQGQVPESDGVAAVWSDAGPPTTIWTDKQAILSPKPEDLVDGDGEAREFPTEVQVPVPKTETAGVTRAEVKGALEDGGQAAEQPRVKQIKIREEQAPPQELPLDEEAPPSEDPFEVPAPPVDDPFDVQEPPVEEEGPPLDVPVEANVEEPGIPYNRDLASVASVWSGDEMDGSGLSVKDEDALWSDPGEVHNSGWSESGGLPNEGHNAHWSDSGAANEGGPDNWTEASRMGVKTIPSSMQEHVADDPASEHGNSAAPPVVKQQPRDTNPIHIDPEGHDPGTSGMSGDEADVKEEELSAEREESMAGGWTSVRPEEESQAGDSQGEDMWSVGDASLRESMSASVWDGDEATATAVAELPVGSLLRVKPELDSDGEPEAYPGMKRSPDMSGDEDSKRQRGSD